MPVPVEDITFTDVGPMGEISTIRTGVGWPADATNDQFAPPLSTVSQMTRNPYRGDPMSDESTADGVTPAEDLDFAVSEEGDSISTKVGTVGWPEGAQNEQPTPDEADVHESGVANVTTEDVAPQAPTQAPAPEPVTPNVTEDSTPDA